MTQTRDLQTVLETFRQHGGVLRTGQALMQGIHPAALTVTPPPGAVTPLRARVPGKTSIPCVPELPAPDQTRAPNSGHRDRPAT